MYLLSSIGGIVAIPIGILICAVYSFYKGNKVWRSGTTITHTPRNGGPVTRTHSDKRMNWFSIPGNIIGLMLVVAAIGIYFWMWSEK